jgi:predicted transcriptional regulator
MSIKRENRRIVRQRTAGVASAKVVTQRDYVVTAALQEVDMRRETPMINL